MIYYDVHTPQYHNIIGILIICSDYYNIIINNRYTVQNNKYQIEINNDEYNFCFHDLFKKKDPFYIVMCLQSIPIPFNKIIYDKY